MAYAVLIPTPNHNACQRSCECNATAAQALSRSLSLSLSHANLRSALSVSQHLFGLAIVCQTFHDSACCCLSNTCPPSSLALPPTSPTFEAIIFTPLTDTFSNLYVITALLGMHDWALIPAPLPSRYSVRHLCSHDRLPRQHAVEIREQIEPGER